MAELKIRNPEDWTRCRWPHEVMSADDEREITALIERYEPMIRQYAKYFAEGDRLLARDLRQRARITIWQVGVQKARERKPGYLRAAIVLTMRAVRFVERTALGGEARLRVHLAPPPCRT